jgi:putative hydrolase of the HAD superfamily
MELRKGKRALADKPEAILFDAGGTLVLQDHVRLAEVLSHEFSYEDSFEAHYRAMDAYARRRITGEAVDWAIWQDDFFGRLGLSDPTQGALLTNSGYGFWSFAIPGTIEAIRDLGIRVAVISNSDGSVTESLRLAGFDGMFEFVIDSHDVGASKPDPVIFQAGLDRLGLRGEEVWYVGDSLFHDIRGALDAGYSQAVLIDPFDLAPEHEPRLHSVAELAVLLTGL